MKLKLLVTTLIVLALGLNTAGAQPRPKMHGQCINKSRNEIARQKFRIHRSQQRNFHQNIRRAKADGVITSRERKGIRMSQRRQSVAVYRNKQNRGNGI